MQIQYLSKYDHHSRIIIIISQDLGHKGATKLFINLFTIPILASISMELREQVLVLLRTQGDGLLFQC